MTITQERLKQLLDYDLETGVFRWRVSHGAKKLGTAAGCLKPDGYICIRIDRKLYLAHQLAFLYVLGALPAEIDHKNRIGTDNAWFNLRAATRRQNLGNTKKQKNNTSGHRGVFWDKSKHLWTAALCNKMLGRFHKLDEAVQAYTQAAQATFGEFYRDN